MKNPIFIIGAPRSGTTILGELFESDSNCRYVLELDIWEEQSQEKVTNTLNLKSVRSMLKFSGRNPKITKLMRTAQAVAINMHIISGPDAVYLDKGHRLDESDVTPKRENLARSYLSEKRLVVKHPYNSLRVPFIKKIFPDAKFIHIVRNGKDVVSSMMNSPSGSLWTYTKPPGWKTWKKFSSGPIRAAWQWKKTIDIINSDRKNISSDDFIEVRYEELLESPEKIVKDVFEKVGLIFGESQKRICKKIQDKMVKKDIAKDDALTVFDHSKRIDRFKENFTQEEIDCIDFVLGESKIK